MADIRNELLKRILILDGAMGTFIQSFGLASEAYHQGRFADWKVALTGNNDVLNLTAPEVISEIHRRYIAAGADIIETNTFSANRISQREYQCEEEAAEMAFAGARLARQAADACKDCSALRQVLILSADTAFSPTAFAGCKDVYIFAPEESLAKELCTEGSGFIFVCLTK